MPTTSQKITAVPTALSDISAGTTYTVQNQSNQVLYIAEAASAPDASESARIEVPTSWGVRVEKDATNEIWIWTDGDPGKSYGAVAINEAV